jgi:hypothetical protein
VRLLPSAKVCFLGGCPRSGRNQDLFRSHSEAEDRRAAGRSPWLANCYFAQATKHVTLLHALS